MKKKLIAVAFFSTLLTACASPKYKISDQNVKTWIGIYKDVVHCIKPNVTNSASFKLLPEDEQSVITEYEFNLLAQVIGSRAYSILKSDPKSWDYFIQRVKVFQKNNVNDDRLKANVLTAEQCNVYKEKFARDLAAIQQKNAEQARINQQKQEKIAQARQAHNAFIQQLALEMKNSMLRKASGNMTQSEVALEIAKQQRLEQSRYQNQQLALQQEQLHMQQQQNQAQLEMQQRQHEERMRMMQNNQNRSYDVSCNNYGGYTTRCQVR